MIVGCRLALAGILVHCSVSRKTRDVYDFWYSASTPVDVEVHEALVYQGVSLYLGFQIRKARVGLLSHCSVGVQLLVGLRALFIGLHLI